MGFVYNPDACWTYDVLLDFIVVEQWKFLFVLNMYCMVHFVFLFLFLQGNSTLSRDIANEGTPPPRPHFVGPTWLPNPRPA